MTVWMMATRSSSAVLQNWLWPLVPEYVSEHQTMFLPFAILFCPRSLDSVSAMQDLTFLQKQPVSSEQLKLSRELVSQGD